MKKLIAISILLALLSTAAFAQLKVGFALDANADFVHSKSYFDDYANVKKADKGPGSFDMMTSNYWDANELRLSFKYNIETVEAWLLIRGDELVTRGAGYFAATDTAGGSSLDGTGNTRNQSLLRFLDQTFEEFYVKGTAGYFGAFVGRFNNRGKMTAFRYGMHDFSSPINNYGYSTVSASGGFGSVDVNNFNNLGFWKPEGFNNPPLASVTTNNAAGLNTTGVNNSPYFNIDFNYQAFTVALAGALSYATNKTEPKANTSFAARVSGTNVADFVTFDVLYRVQGQDPTMKGRFDVAYGDTYNGVAGATVNSTTGNVDNASKAWKEADGRGSWYNAFGLYGGFKLMDNTLGIGLGYTGSFVVYEDAKIGSDTYKRNSPYYNGIDLRVQFTGVDKLTATLNNNISFSVVKGTKNDNKTRQLGLFTGTSGSGLADKVEESYFFLYNALAAKYMVAEKVSANLEVTNRAGWANAKNDGTKTTDIVSDSLRMVLYANYAFSPNIFLESGLAMQIDHLTNKKATGLADGSTELKGGTFYFGIPIRVKMSF